MDVGQENGGTNGGLRGGKEKIKEKFVPSYVQSKKAPTATAGHRKSQVSNGVHRKEKEEKL